MEGMMAGMKTQMVCFSLPLLGEVGNLRSVGHDGTANGHHGLDQLLLPGFRPQCVFSALLESGGVLTGGKNSQAPVPADTRVQVDAAARY